MAVGTDEVVYTTNAEDQNAVAELRKRIAQSNANANVNANDDGNGTCIGGAAQDADWTPVPSVSIAEGAHKYVLISATEPQPQPGSTSTSTSTECYTNFFVTSKRGAAYHRNAAEPYVNLLQSKGYKDINVTGGGRIYYNEDEKKIAIYGYSYGFGLGDHARSKEVIEGDERFKGYDISWTNDGY